MSDDGRSRCRISFVPFPLPLLVVERGGADGEGGGCCDPLELFGALLPPEARGHLRAARIECLRALRAMLERRIDDLERRGGGKRRAEKIPVEEEDA